jgi:hypothetical protein
MAMNKKGAEMTVGTIVVIILALVVLVILIYGFTMGWGNLWQNILGLGGGKVNVQTVIQSCQVQCTTGSQYEYCSRPRAVVFEKIDGKDNPLNKPDYTCASLEKIPSAGLPACGSITCGSTTVLGKTCKGWSGDWIKPPCTSDKNPDLSKIDISSESYNLVLASDRQQNPNMVCCVAKKDCTGWSGKWMTVSPGCDPTQYYEINPSFIIQKDVSDHGGSHCCAS